MEAALDSLNCSQDVHTLRPRIQSTAQIHCDRKCGRSDTAVIGITDDSVGVSLYVPPSAGGLGSVIVVIDESVSLS